MACHFGNRVAFTLARPHCEAEGIVYELLLEVFPAFGVGLLLLMLWLLVVLLDACSSFAFPLGIFTAHNFPLLLRKACSSFTLLFRFPPSSFLVPSALFLFAERCFLRATHRLVTGSTRPSLLHCSA